MNCPCCPSLDRGAAGRHPAQQQLRARSRQEDHEAQARRSVFNVTAAMTAGRPSQKVAPRLGEALYDLAEGLSRHDTMLGHVMALLRYGRNGEPGVERRWNCSTAPSPRPSDPTARAANPRPRPSSSACVPTPSRCWPTRLPLPRNGCSGAPEGGCDDGRYRTTRHRLQGGSPRRRGVTRRPSPARATRRHPPRGDRLRRVPRQALLRRGRAVDRRDPCAAGLRLRAAAGPEESAEAMREVAVAGCHCGAVPYAADDHQCLDAGDLPVPRRRAPADPDRRRGGRAIRDEEAGREQRGPACTVQRGASA